MTELAVALATAEAPAQERSWLRAAWDGLLALLGALVGLAPHVLHHVGFLAGTAVAAGSGGTALFGVVGLLASVPLLLRLRRLFGTWRAPAVGLVVFTAMFALSAFVLGPELSGEAAVTSTTDQGVDHDSHHPGGTGSG